MVVNTTMWVLHVVFSGLWTGSILFVVGFVMPAAYRGDIGVDLLGSALSKLQSLTRISAVVFLVTGGYLTVRLYTGYPPTVDALLSTSSGRIVLWMFILWVVVTGLVEAGASKVHDGLEDHKLREPARNARRSFQAAAVGTIFLLITGGLLAAGV